MKNRLLKMQSESKSRYFSLRPKRSAKKEMQPPESSCIRERPVELSSTNITYGELEKAFLKSPDAIKTKNVLLDYGIKEPYATNITLRLFLQAYCIIKQLTP